MRAGGRQRRPPPAPIVPSGGLRQGQAPELQALFLDSDIFRRTMMNRMPTDDMPGAIAPKKRRRRRWILGGGAVFLLALGLLVVFLPAILSIGFVRDRIAGAAGARLGTKVEIRSVAFSWFGSQEIRDLRVASPAPDEASEDLVRVPRAVIGLGLLDLLASKNVLRLEVDEPIVRLSRNAGGRFNFDGLGGERKEARPPRGAAPADDGASSGGSSAGGRGFSREIHIVVRQGLVAYKDAALGTASSVEGIEAVIDVKGAEARIEASGVVREEGGAPGGFRVDAVAAGLADPGAEPSVSARAEVKDLDLRPYRALVARLAGVGVPEKPLGGRIDVASREEGLDLSADLDAGFGKLERVVCKMPRKGGGGDAALDLAWSFDLPGAFDFIKPRAAAPEGARAGGSAAGTLAVTAPLSLEGLSAKGLAGTQFEVRLDGNVRDLDLLWPRAQGTSAGEPIHLSQKEISLAVLASAEIGAGTLVVKNAHVAGQGIKAAISGSMRSRSATPAAAGAGSATRRAVDLSLSAEAAVPEIIALLGAALPPRVEMAPESVVRISELSLHAEVGGDISGLPAWNGKGRMEARGPVKYGGVAVAGLSSGFRIEEGVLEFPGLVCGVNGGEVRAEALSLRLGEAPTYRALLRAEGVAAHYDMAPLLAYVLPFIGAEEREAELSGTIGSTLEIQGKGFGPESLRNSLSGSGSIRVVDGRIAASPFFRELASLLRSDLREVVFQEIGSDFKIGAGKVSSRNVFLEAREGSKLRNLGLEGTTTFDGKIDYGVNLSSLKETVGDKRARRILDYAEKLLGGGMLPLKLRGTTAKPELSLEPGIGGLDLEGILEGRIPLPESSQDVPEKEQPAQEKPRDRRQDRREEIEKGIQDILDLLKKR